MSDDYVLEALIDEQAVALEPAVGVTGLEVAIEEVSSVKNVPGSVAMEPANGPIQPPWQIAGSDPTANPAVLVWFDTQGA